MLEDPAQLHLLYELACAFAARIDLDELSAFVVQKCREVLDAEGAAILLFDQERNELYFPYVADVDATAGARVRNLRFPAERGFAGSVLRDGRPLRVDDAATDPRFYGGVDRESGVTTGACRRCCDTATRRRRKCSFAAASRTSLAMQRAHRKATTSP